MESQQLTVKLCKVVRISLFYVDITFQILDLVFYYYFWDFSHNPSIDDLSKRRHVVWSSDLNQGCKEF